MIRIEMLRKMPTKCFSEMVFDVVKNEVENEVEFRNWLMSELPKEGLEEMEKALHELQHLYPKSNNIPLDVKIDATNFGQVVRSAIHDNDAGC